MTESALHRYLSARGKLLLGSRHAETTVSLLRASAVVLLIISTVIVIGAILTRPGVALGAIGPALAGAIHLLIAEYTRRKYAAIPSRTLELSKDGLGLLTALERQRSARAPYTQWFATGQNPNELPVKLRESELAQAHELLQSVAIGANRLLAVAEATPESESNRWANRLRLAADAAMVEAMNVVALLVRFPESERGMGSRLTDLASKVSELATHAERLQMQEVLRFDLSSGMIALDAVLEEARLADQAQLELDRPR
ncbi:MAG: hypothetical protein SFX74_11375 [Fimbriimonadaceae bacterium]|nr:hypothetical protein [Fimbriimonadaceae bacterium]